MKTTDLINLINNKGFIDLNLASFNKIEKTPTIIFVGVLDIDLSIYI